jgi:hypothetical protein
VILLLKDVLGHSIRLGTAWKDGSTGDITKKPFKSSDIDQSPNLLMRVGPDPTAKATTDGPFGLVIEDINKDATSLWMVSDQIIPLKFATEASKIHGLSVVEMPIRLGNAQIVMNSDRIVLNARKEKILLHSNKGIHITTLEDVSVDADRDHITWTTRNRLDRVVQLWKSTVGNDWDVSVQNEIRLHGGNNLSLSSRTAMSLVGKTIHIGSKSDTAEPLVLGSALRDCLDELITLLTTQPVVLVTGSPGSPSTKNPQLIVKLKMLQSKYLSGGKTAKILSQHNYTVRDNDTPQPVRSISLYKES